VFPVVSRILPVSLGLSPGLSLSPTS